MGKKEKQLIGTGSEHIRKRDHAVNEKWVEECEKYINKHLEKELSRINGVFLPGDDFYVYDDNPDIVLRYMAANILRWLKIELKDGELGIAFHDMEVPGFYTELNGKKFILVNSQYKGDIFAIGAILAHEIMHFYLLGKKNLRMEDELENELLTDLCTIKFGLGLPIINGMSYSNSWFLSILLIFVGILHWRSEKLSFGYFNPNQYGELCYVNLQEKKLAIEDVGGYIRPSSRTFLSQGIGLFWRNKNGSLFISRLTKRKKQLLAIKVILLAIAIALFAFFSQQDQKKQEILGQQEIYINNLENSLKSGQQEIEKTLAEFEELQTKIDEYERSGNTDAYNALVPIYNDKLEVLRNYQKRYQEYERQIDDYNSKL